MTGTEKISVFSSENRVNIPVYPLDGSQVMSGILPQNLLSLYEWHMPYGFFIILLLMMTGLLSVILVPAVQVSLSFLAAVGLLR